MHVAITGASSGIGAALVHDFASHGADITLVARRKNLMDQLSSEVAGKTYIVEQDLADLAHCTDWIEHSEQALGSIDVMINNAGVQLIGNTHEIDIECAENLLRLNVMAPFRITHKLLMKMRERRSGAIVDIASVAALAPTPWMYHYSASKAAIGAASETLHRELKGTGVHVVTVYPGIISETDMGRRGIESYEKSIGLSLQPDGNTKKLASLIRQAVEKKKARVIYPGFNKVARWFPGVTRLALDSFTPALSKEIE